MISVLISISGHASRNAAATNAVCARASSLPRRAQDDLPRNLGDFS